MTTRLVAYLNFAGNAADAVRYYQSIFGGEVQIARFADYGLSDMPADGTMHAELSTPHFLLMASDAIADTIGSWGDTRMYLALISDEQGLMTDWFDQLAADGEIAQPLAKQVWGDIYGLVKDKYGVEWMFNVHEPGAWNPS